MFGHDSILLHQFNPPHPIELLLSIQLSQPSLLCFHLILVLDLLFDLNSFLFHLLPSLHSFLLFLSLFLFLALLHLIVHLFSPLLIQLVVLSSHTFILLLVLQVLSGTFKLFDLKALIALEHLGLEL